MGRTGLDFTRLRGSLLAPGLGAQGATVADLQVVFGAAIGSVLSATSRELLAVGPAPAPIRDLARRILGRIATAVGVG